MNIKRRVAQDQEINSYYDLGKQETGLVFLEPKMKLSRLSAKSSIRVLAELAHMAVVSPNSFSCGF
jgi:hypothetical protein